MITTGLILKDYEKCKMQKENYEGKRRGNPGGFRLVVQRT